MKFIGRTVHQAKLKEPAGPKELDPTTQPGYIHYTDGITESDLDRLRHKVERMHQMQLEK